jgi:hypothetical protein
MSTPEAPTPDEPKVIGAYSQTPESEAAKATSQAKPPPEMEPRIEAKIPRSAARGFLQRWWPLILKAAMKIGAFASGLLTVAWTLALWDSYRPKITVTPGPSMNPKEPFGSTFIIQNQGALSIRNVSFDSTWFIADDANPTNQVRNVFMSPTAIGELKSLEQHFLTGPILMAGAQATNLPPSVQMAPIPSLEHHSIILSFDVTYDPQYFGRRTDTLYFVGGWDSETNFQWLPTGHTDIRTTAFDPVRVKRAQDFIATLKRQKEQLLSNAPPQASNPPSGTANAAGSSPVHTNEINHK